ncbi:hypothetical protein IV203_000061 [Nitzschia inconspicua]|uniref:Uncharacterized protein n=1 Tax=Nitzschia inconspicua TaxID=303405 RepID=A0A9K3PPM0_9STRA|nr:hypothetical protein IV203_000061 [Nitzschia inconspicua]
MNAAGSKFLFAAIFQSLAHVQAVADDNYFFRDPFQAPLHVYLDANLGDTEEVDVVDVQTLANASGYSVRIVDNNHFLINSKQISRMTVTCQSKRRSCSMLSRTHQLWKVCIVDWSSRTQSAVHS